MQALALLPQFEPLLGQLAEFGNGVVFLAGSDRLLQLVEPEVEDVVPVREGADILKPLAQFQRQGPQCGPSLVQVEHHLFADEVEAVGEPVAEAELPVLQTVE